MLGCLEKLLPGYVKPSRFTLEPYRSVNRFTFADHWHFYGRQKAQEKLLKMCQQQWQMNQGNEVPNTNPMWLMVEGASGTGKSSLVEAGLLPLLCRPQTMQKLSKVAWVRIELGRTEQAELMPHLALKLLTVFNQSTSEEQQTEFKNLLIKDSVKAEKWFRHHLQEQHSKDSAVVLFIDQFEQLWLDTTNTPKQQHLFINVLIALCQTANACIWVISTLRSDDSAKLSDFKQLTKLLSDKNHDYVIQPDRESIAEMVIKPAEKLEYTFERDLEQKIIDDAVKYPDNLVQLQMLLTRLAHLAKQDPIHPQKMRSEHFNALGRIAGIISTRAEEVYQTLTENQQALFPILLSHIVVVDITATPHSKTANFDQLLNSLKDEQQRKGMKALVNSFSQEQFIRRFNDKVRKITTEKEIGEELRYQFPNDDQQQQFHNLVSLEGEKDKGKENDVNQVEYLQIGHEALLSKWPRVTEWAKQEAIKSAQKKRRKKWFGVVASLCLIALGLVFYAQYEETRKESLRNQSAYLMELVKSSNNKGFYDDAILLGLNAMPGLYGGGNRPLPENIDPLKASLMNANKHAVLFQESRNSSAKYSKSGQWILTESHSSAVLWDARTAKQLKIFEYENGKTDARFSANSEWVITSSTTVKYTDLWSLSKGLHRTQIQDSSVLGVSISSNSKLALVVNNKRSVRLYDLESEKYLLTPFEHKESVRNLKFNKAGHKFIVITDSEIVVRDTLTGKEIKRQNLDDIFQSLNFDSSISKDGTWVAVWNSNVYVGQVILWNTETGEEQHVRGIREAIGVEFNERSTSILAHSSDRAVLWRMQPKKPLIILRSEEKIESALLIKDGDGFITTSNGGVRVWVPSKKIVNNINEEEPFEHESYGIYDPFISEDGRFLVTFTKSDVAELWDIATKTKLNSYQHRGPISSGSFSPRDNKILTVSQRGEATIWAFYRSGLKDLVPLKGSKRIKSINFDVHGKVLVNFNREGPYRVHEGESTFFLSDFGYTNKSFALAPLNPVPTPRFSSLFFSKDLQKVVRVSETGESAEMWNTEKGKKLYDFSIGDNFIQKSEFSPNGRWLVFSSNRQTVELYDTETGDMTKRLHGFGLADWVIKLAKVSKDAGTSSAVQQSKFNNLKRQAQFVFPSINSEISTAISYAMGKGFETTTSIFSHDSQFVVSVFDTADYALLFDVESGEEVRRFEVSEPIKEAVFSSNDRFLFFLTKMGNIRIFDVSSGRELDILAKENNPSNQKMIIHPKLDHMILTYSQTNIAITNVLNGNKFLELNAKVMGLGEISDVSISPDGSWLLIVSENIEGGKKATIYDIENRVELFSLGVLGTPIFGPNSKSIFVHSTTKGPQVMNIGSGGVMCILDANYDSKIEHLANNAAFSSDGKLLATSKMIDDKVKVWDLEICDLKVYQNAIRSLPLNRKCLSNVERRKFNLLELSPDQIVKRGC